MPKVCLTTIRYLLLAASFLVIQKASFGQNDSLQQALVDSARIRYDSDRNQLFKRIKQYGDSEQNRNLREYIEDTIATRQDETMQMIKSLTLEAQNYVENGVDTTGLAKEIKQIEHWYDIVSDGVFKNTGTIQTYRNLETSYKVMRELLVRMSDRKSSLDNFYARLVHYRNTIDSLYKEEVLYSFSSDSAVLMRYAEKLTIVLQEIKPSDSSLKKTLIRVSELQPPVNLLVNKLSSSLEQIEIFQIDLSSRTFNRETSNLGGPVRFVRRFDEIINFSLNKAALAFFFYVRNEIGKIILLAILVIFSTLFLVSLKRNMRKQDLLDKSDEQAVLKYPFLSALVIVLNIFQFIFIDPPFIFSGLIWIVSSVALLFILRGIVARYWMFALWTMFFLFLLACFDDLILQASRPERWLMLGLSIAGILCGAIMILTGPKAQLKEILFIYFVGFVVIMQIVAIVTNVYGRYNLSKTCLTAGYFNLILAVLFYWTLRLMNQGFAMAGRLYSRPGKKLFNINFELVGGKAPTIFYVLLFVGWFILFARNFYVSKYISVPLTNFIVQKRMIGEFSFTIGSVLECFLILYLSAVISRMVSFFATDTQATEKVSADRRGGIGSWLLIIRICIITLGLLAAFAALGIPMDRLTIILSALSVGIGFGLQSLVNNLVSGLIISFEKPVNIGDFVEVGGQSGIVKSIGFRSSILATPAGANVVIPNGNLLNQHLVNWTRDNNSRSIDIPVAVAHGTDLERAITILKELPAKDERILPTPAPGVAITQFNNGSVDMHLSFWVKNISDSGAVKSDMLLAIDRAFKENSIQIPLPLQFTPASTALVDGGKK